MDDGSVPGSCQAKRSTVDSTTPDSTIATRTPGRRRASTQAATSGKTR
jgi:hypothetical protein